MDNVYLDNNKSYNTLSYDDLHKFLAKRLHVSYAKFRPAGAREEDKDPAESDGEIGSVASAGIITPAAAAGPAFRVDNDDDETRWLLPPPPPPLQPTLQPPPPRAAAE
jgi:hypothetical protein